MLTVRECSSIEILRIGLKGDPAALFALGTHVIFPAQTAGLAAKKSEKTNGNASVFAQVLMIHSMPFPVSQGSAYPVCAICYEDSKTLTFFTWREKSHVFHSFAWLRMSWARGSSQLH
jgi:hypothetical protein